MVFAPIVPDKGKSKLGETYYYTKPHLKMSRYYQKYTSINTIAVPPSRAADKTSDFSNLG